jgi:hypothetical protein
MSRYSTIDRYITVEGLCERKGEYLANNATPVQCAETLMQNITLYIKGLLEPRQNETADEAAARYELAREYVKVLDYMMEHMAKEVLHAVERLATKEERQLEEQEYRRLLDQQRREKERRDRAADKIAGGRTEI